MLPALARVVLSSLVFAGCAPGPAPGPAISQGPGGAPRAAGESATEEEVVSDPAPLRRIVVLGASASAGFKLTTDLGQALDLALDIEHDEILCLADPWFFSNPLPIGERQVEAALAHEPTLVVAADFLFWFGYGSLPTLEARLERLEIGFELLERFDCPVMASGFPDMSAAVGKILRAKQMPDPESLARLDARAKEWIAARPAVLGVPLPEWIEELKSGGLTVSGVSWPTDPEVAVMQPDDLHPTLAGQAALAVGILERLAVARPSLPRSALVLDPDRVLAGLTDLVAAQARPRAAR